MDRCILKIVNKGKAVISMQFNKGTIKPTDNQYKYLYSKLSNRKKAYAKKLASKLNSKTTFSFHCMDKVTSNKVVLDKDLLKSIMAGNYSIIELNTTNNHDRVLLRSNNCNKYNVSGKSIYCNLCIVYQPYKNVIITMYNNDVFDNHVTLDKKRYK